MSTKKKVYIYGNGIQSQWVEVEGYVNNADAKRAVAARYPGAIIGEVSSCPDAPQHPVNMSFTSSSPSKTYKPNPEFTSDDIHPDDSSSSNSSGSYSGGSSSSVGGLGGLLFIVIVGVVGYALVGGDNGKEKLRGPQNGGNGIERVAPTPEKKKSTNHHQLPQNRPLSVPQKRQSYTSAESNACKVWADANPALAAKLTSGDRCWGEF